MRPKKPKTRSGDLFRARLDQIINLKHELAQLAGQIDWDFIDGEIAPLYSDKGRPGIPTRLAIGLCCSSTFTGCPMKACASQRHPLRRRIQLPAYPRMAQGSLAPIPDRDPAPLDQRINPHSAS